MKMLIAITVLLSAFTSYAEESNTTATAPAAITAPSQGQTAAPVAKVAPEAVAKKWKVGYNFRALYGRVDADSGTGSVSNRNRFTFGYNLGPASVAIKPTWTNSYNVDTGIARISAGDLILEVAKGGIALNHDWSLNTTGRYYLPTSETSRLLASNGMAFADLLFTRPIGTRFTAVFEGTYTKTFQNQRTAYAVKSTKTNAKVSKKNQKNAPQNLPVDQISAAEGNARYDMSHQAALEYKINKKWAFTQVFAYTNAYTYGNSSQAVASTSNDTFTVQSIFSYAPVKNFSLDMGLSQDRDRDARAAQPKYTYMADAETQYYLEASISL